MKLDIEKLTPYLRLDEPNLLRLEVRLHRPLTRAQLEALLLGRDANAAPIWYLGLPPIRNG